MTRRTRALQFLLLITCQGLIGAQASSRAAANPPMMVAVVAEGEVLAAPCRTFVVTHGFGGTEEADRFHELAKALKAAYRDANVYRLDWSQAAIAVRHGMLDPWTVAKRIDTVALTAADELKDMGVDASIVTLIGESFGVYVNQQIAMRLGGIDYFIACNPANELGGYVPTDVRGVSAHSFALVSRSNFDTLHHIAEYELVLSTPEEATVIEKHTLGIQWLCRRIRDRGDAYLDFDSSAAQASDDFFSGAAQSDGSVQLEQIQRVVKSDEVVNQARPAATTVNGTST